MTMRTNCILLLAILLGAFPLNRVHADESGSIILYTPRNGLRVDSDRHSSHSRRILEDCILSHNQCVLCGILAEFGHSVFALLPSGGHLGIGFGGGMVVFQRVLYDDCQSGCQGVESLIAGISLSDSQLPGIYSRSDVSGAQRTVQ